jgi:hypothetical protein
VKFVTAAEIARANGLDPKRYRQSLRDAKLAWYVHGAAWTVELGSQQHDDMLRVLKTLIEGRSLSPAPVPAGRTESLTSGTSDESYVIGLCDTFLGRVAVRQHRFEFLRGDAGAGKVGRMLPVDTWYADLALVIEYRERQHSDKVGFFDRRMTMSGTYRGHQRALYDQRRRDILPLHGITLIEFDYFEFDHSSARRLVRCAADRQIVAEKLQRFIA